MRQWWRLRLLLPWMLALRLLWSVLSAAGLEGAMTTVRRWSCSSHQATRSVRYRLLDGRSRLRWTLAC